jgi:hypothetical protein
VEGSCVILGEGKTLQRKMKKMFLKGKFLGEVKKKIEYFFLMT